MLPSQPVPSTYALVEAFISGKEGLGSECLLANRTHCYTSGCLSVLQHVVITMAENETLKERVRGLVCRWNHMYGDI